MRHLIMLLPSKYRDINMHQETAFWRFNWKGMLFSSVSGAPGSHADDAFSCKDSSIGIKLSKKVMYYAFGITEVPCVF